MKKLSLGEYGVFSLLEKEALSTLLSTGWFKG